VDGGEHGLAARLGRADRVLQPLDVAPQVDDVALALSRVVRLHHRELCQVEPGAEVLALAREHGGAHARVRLDGAEDVDQLGEHRRVHRVELVGPRERHVGDRADLTVLDRRVARPRGVAAAAARCGGGRAVSETQNHENKSIGV
jgi:hypothetical protein